LLQGPGQRRGTKDSKDIKTGSPSLPPISLQSTDSIIHIIIVSSAIKTASPSLPPISLQSTDSVIHIVVIVIVIIIIIIIISSAIHYRSSHVRHHRRSQTCLRNGSSYIMTPP